MKTFDKTQYFQFDAVLLIYDVADKNKDYHQEMRKVISDLNKAFGENILIEKIKEATSYGAIIDENSHFCFEVNVQISFEEKNYDRAMDETITKILAISGYREIKIKEISGKHPMPEF